MGPRFPTEGLSRLVWERDRVCVYCGANVALEIDHVLPWSKGGPTIAGNLVLACRPCNGRKGARVSVEHMAYAFRYLLAHGEDLSWTDASTVGQRSHAPAHGSGTVRPPAALPRGKRLTPASATPQLARAAPRAARPTPPPPTISGIALTPAVSARRAYVGPTMHDLCLRCRERKPSSRLASYCWDCSHGKLRGTPHRRL